MNAIWTTAQITMDIVQMLPHTYGRNLKLIEKGCFFSTAPLQKYI